jgi:hypothetical protein
VQNLFWHPNATRRERKAIEATYRYPLTNTSTYYDWLRMGGQGPSPHQWCGDYARVKVGNPLFGLGQGR